MSYPDYQPYLDKALARHRETPVFVGYYNFSLNQFQPTGGRQCDLEKMAASHVHTFVASIGLGCYFQTGPQEYALAGPDEWLYRQLLERVDWVADTIDKCPRTRLVARAGELDASRNCDGIGVIVHMTGNNQYVSIEAVDEFFRHGVRAIHPALQYHDKWCRGIRGKPAPVLTDFGREVIQRCNELGILLDVAHASDESAQAIIQASQKPVIDGHTTSSGLVPESRGLSDETLKMLANSGGVVGIHFADHMLTSEVWREKSPLFDKDGVPKPGYTPRLWEYNRHVLASTKDPDERMRLRRHREEQDKFFEAHGLAPDPETPTTRVATLRHMGDTIEYLANLVGIEHVGLGGDVDGIGDDQWPLGMDHVGELPHLTAELLRRGWGEDSLRKFLWENWYRVYSESLPSAPVS